MNKLVRVVLLSAGLSGLLFQTAQADELKGSWLVKSLTTTTLTLDGKEKLKGPFVVKPKDMWLEVNATQFIYHEDGKTLSYRLRKQGKGYQLSRNEEGDRILLSLSNIRRGTNQLTFTTTHKDAKREERTVVGFVCTPKQEQEDLPAQLSGTRWQLREIAYNDGTTFKPKGKEKMTLEFGEDGKVSGNAGVNQFSGTYTANAKGQLSIGRLTMTRAINPSGSIANTYVKVLRSARLYLFNKGMLVLDLPYDSGEMSFTKLP